MRTASKRFLSFLLVAVLLLSATPFAAFAADTETQETTEVTTEATTEATTETTTEATTEVTTEATTEVTTEATTTETTTEATTTEATTTVVTSTAAEEEEFFGEVPGENAMGLATTKNVGIVFVILDQDGNEIAKKRVTRDGEYLGNPLVKASFGAADRIGGADFNDYVWPATLEWNSVSNGSGVPYQKNANLRDVVGATDKDGNPVGNGSIPNRYFVKVYAKELIVKVQVQWAEGNTTKTVDIVPTISVPLKDVKNTEIVDYMSNVGHTATVRGFVSAGQVTDKDGKTYDVSGYSWNELWYVGGSRVGKSKFTRDTTVVAKLVKEKVTVTFDPGVGGSVNPTSKVIPTNTAYGTMPVPTMAGYKFMGWFEEADASATYDTTKNKLVLTNPDNKQYFNTTLINQDITLHAVWLQEVEVELYVYNSKKADATPSSVGKITGLLAGTKLTTADVTKMLTNSSGMKGPFDKDGAATDVDSWKRFIQQGSADLYLPVLSGGERVAVYVPSGSINASGPNNTGNVNVDPSAPVVNTNSSATYDPSNPKTGDLAAVRLNVAAFALAFSVIGLAGIFVVSRKKNFGL